MNSNVADTGLQALAETLNRSDQITQHSLSCMVARMVTIPELQAHLKFDISETSLRDSVARLILLGLLHRLETKTGVLIGLTPNGSYISPLVKKMLFEETVQPNLF